MPHPKKHHYIPEFYLKRWATGPQRQLCEFSRPFSQVKPRRTSPGGTGYVERLYALSGFPADLEHQVEERFFKSVDQLASDAMDALEHDGSNAQLDVDHRSAWSRFMVSLLTRCPEDLADFRFVWTSTMRNFSPEAEEEYRKTRGPGDPRTFDEYYRTRRALPERERDMFTALIGLIDNPSLGQRLNSYQFEVINFPDDVPELLTSDRPIIRNHSGLAAPGGHIALPIGPRALFVTAPRTDVLVNLKNADRGELAEASNLEVVRHAARFAYASSDRVLEFVKAHFGTVPEPRLIAQQKLRAVERLITEAQPDRALRALRR
jgi:hypothetical protein